MKTNYSNIRVSAVTILAGLVLNVAVAGKSPQFDSIKKELRAGATAEMPAKAAQIVKQAKADRAESTTEGVVTAVTEIRPAAVVAVVSAIARENPEMAAVAAAKAAALQPKEAPAIARAAVGAAPEQMAKIVYAVCKVVPTRYSQVAVAVAQVNPAATKEILAAVTLAVPSLRPFVDRASAGNLGASMGYLMAQTEGLVQATAHGANITPEQLITAPTSVASGPSFAPLPPPTVGPPYQPIGGTPIVINRTNTVEVPPGGGRNYSGP